MPGLVPYFVKPATKDVNYLAQTNKILNCYHVYAASIASIRKLPNMPLLLLLPDSECQSSPSRFWESRLWSFCPATSIDLKCYLVIKLTDILIDVPRDEALPSDVISTSPTWTHTKQMTPHRPNPNTISSFPKPFPSHIQIICKSDSKRISWRIHTIRSYDWVDEKVVQLPISFCWYTRYPKNHSILSSSATVYDKFQMHIHFTSISYVFWFTLHYFLVHLLASVILPGLFSDHAEYCTVNPFPMNRSLRRMEFSKRIYAELQKIQSPSTERHRKLHELFLQTQDKQRIMLSHLLYPYCKWRFCIGR